MAIARQVVNHLLGKGDVNTVDALKHYLQVEQLEVILVESLDEYMELVCTDIYLGGRESSAPREPERPEPV